MSSQPRPRTYGRNAVPLKRTRTASSPTPSSPPPAKRPTPSHQANLASQPPSCSLPPPPLSSSSPLQPSTRPPQPARSSPSAAPRPSPASADAGETKASGKGKGKASSTAGGAVQGTLRGFFTLAPGRSRPPSRPAAPPAAAASAGPSSSSSSTAPTPGLQQLLLAPLPPTTHLLTCQTCHMTFSPSSPPDVSAHGAFHRTVERGVAWFRPREVGEGEGVEEVGGEVRWGGEGGEKGGGRARFVRVHGVPPGKVGKKIKQIHTLIDAHLSSPALPPTVLARTQTFLLLSPSPPPTPTPSTSASSTVRRTSTASSAAGAGKSEQDKEYVVGACVVQRIQSALRVLSADEVRALDAGGTSGGGAGGEGAGEGVVCVDAGPGTDGGGVFCSPTLRPALLGIHRIHLSSLFRRLSLGQTLLSTAASHAVYGVEVARGRVAFSQPTGDGRRLMERWGAGEVGVFVEDDE